MKDFITPSLTFTPGASGIGNVDLYGIAGFDVKRLVSIINQTTGTIIYSTADTALRYTQVIGTTVYLNFDTATMSGANTIQVVYDTPYPLPVSVSSLPLPVGAATANNQATEISVLNAINDKNPTLVSGRVPVDGSGVTQPVSAASLPLPTGAATESKQSDGNASLTSIDSKTPSLIGGKVPVDISSTVAVSGPLTDGQLRASAVPVSISTAVPVTGPLTDAQLRSSAVPISGTVTANTGLSQPLTDTQLRASAVPVSGPLTDTQLRASAVPVSAASLPLPTGAASLAEQQSQTTLLTAIEVDTTAIATSVASINTKVPAQGQAAMAASMPVVIANNQSSIPVSAPSPTLTTYTQAGVIAINTVLVSVDCTQARFLSIQCTSMGTTGVVTPEWSNDNTTWVGAQIVSSATGAAVTTFNSALLLSTPVYARYFRLRLSTATTAGTTTLQVQQFDFFASPTTQAVSLSALPALIAGTAAIGDVGVQYRATNTGAATSLAVQSPATPAATTIKATAGRLIGYYLQNSSTGIRSVKVFNVVAGSVVLGTTSAAFAIDLPANGIAQLHFEGGIAFSTAMTYSVSSAKGLTDNTATGLAANDVSGFFAFA
jgi:hypothetical protein